MQKIILITTLTLLVLLTLKADSAATIPRDSNFNNTNSYSSTQVQARINIAIDQNVDRIHFIRDNNDPRVVTKAYRLKNVDAYEFRDFIRQMVQAKRVGNTSLQQIYPSNSTSSPYIATASYAEASSTTSQPTYSPTSQLGSNTAVECIRYVDGTGLLIISAEEYRFEDNENGWGFDRIVEFMDKPQMGADFGTQTFFYIPKYVPARNLQPLIENVGMNVSDVSEIWQGSDLVAYDSDLNWLIFDTTNYSMYNIEEMLKKFDQVIPQVKLKFTIYEVYIEDDNKIGMDFQAWKNNDGLDFFSTGARFRDNWQATYGGSLEQTNATRTSFYNFNPKWNTRYIDFLVSKGNAKITHSGELVIRNNTAASFVRETQIFYMDKSNSSDDVLTTPDTGVGAYELLSTITSAVIPSSEEFPIGKDTLEEVEKESGFGFSMTITNASVNLEETRFELTLENSSLIGFESDGTPRIATDNKVSVTVSLPHNGKRFMVGGLKKQEEVTSRSGIPWLMDIPILKYLFSSESTSIKNSELILVGECSYDGASSLL